MKKEQAIVHIHRDQCLSDVMRFEKVRMEQIVDLALMHENSDNHWQMYETLKEMVSSITGYEARHTGLCTPGHYTVMLEFIDWLLVAGEQTAPLKIEV